MSDLTYRSEYLLKVLKKHQIPKTAKILEVGSGDDRNLLYLEKNGYTDLTGIDKADQTPLETYEGKGFDLVFTMSCLFLIKDEDVVKKLAQLTNEWLITIEGETTKGEVTGRDYQKVFEPLGFTQVEHQTEVFNAFGQLRVFKKNEGIN